MKTYKPEEVRVVGIFGHRGTGKTSLAEACLFQAGATSKPGSPDTGNLTLEIDPYAVERRLTMQANVGHLEWDGVRVGLVDTPGDGNYWGATSRTLDVIDAALLLVSAVDGIEPITLRALQGLDRRKLPFAVFVSKLDKETADHAAIVEDLKGEIGRDPVLLTLPIGSGAQLRGVVNLLNQRAYLSDGERTVEADVPGDMAAEVARARELLFDAVAAADDALAEKYLEEGTLTPEELSQGLRAAFLKRALAPILCGNPAAGIGARVVLDLVRDAFPAPLERPVLRGTRSPGGGEPVERAPRADGPVLLRVFRTYHDPFAGMLSFARVFAGTLQAGTDLYNTSRDTSDRPSHVYLAQGGTKAGVEVKEAHAGDLVVLTKLKNTHTGDTLCSKDEPMCLPRFEEPEALLMFGVAAADKKDEDKISSLIGRLVEEDPSLRFERDPQSKEMLLGGLGQTHIDGVVDKLKASGISVELREPKVPYQETIRGAVRDVEGKHKKQSGGHGQFGVCYVHVEPLSRGAGFEFVDAIVGGAIPRQFIPSVEKGIRDALTRGPLSGNTVVDIKVTLYDGKYHKVDSSDMAFQMAGRKAIREVFKNPRAKPVLLEPYMELDISCPAENVGDVMGDLNSRRARVHNMTTEGNRGRVQASVPMNEILRYTNVLKSITSGRGSFTMKFDRYEEAPPSVQQQVTAAHQTHEDED